jgi:hypothetical protein
MTEDRVEGLKKRAASAAWEWREGAAREKKSSRSPSLAYWVVVAPRANEA